MKFYAYAAAVLLICSSLIAGCSSTPDERDSKLLASDEPFPLSALSYYRGIPLAETKKAATTLAENMQTSIPLDQGVFTISGQDFDPDANTWSFQVNIADLPNFATAEDFAKSLTDPEARSQMESALASAFCQTGEDARSFRTILANGLKLRYNLFYKNQHVTDIDVTKDSYCRKL